MFKYATLFVVAGIVILPAANHELEKSETGFSANHREHYIVKNATGAQCELLTLYDAPSGINRVFPQAGCDRIAPSIAMARAWRFDGNGDVELDDERGRALIALRESAPSTYTNLNPAYLKLTVERRQ